jgi:hypothetical protein
VLDTGDTFGNDCGDNDLGYLWDGNRDCRIEGADKT